MRVATSTDRGQELPHLRRFVRHIIPIGALFAVVLWLGNTCYLYLAVSFIQMLKAMMPVAVFLVGVMVGTEKYSHRAALNMVVVAAGVALATYGEMSFVLVGVILQVIAIFCESFRIVLVQVLFRNCWCLWCVVEPAHVASSHPPKNLETFHDMAGAQADTHGDNRTLGTACIKAQATTLPNLLAACRCSCSKAASS